MAFELQYVKVKWCVGLVSLAAVTDFCCFLLFLSRCEISLELKKQVVQWQCENLRQRDVEMNDQTYKKRFSIETLSEELKPPVPCLFRQFVIF